jgi:hypothetical protein
MRHRFMGTMALLLALGAPGPAAADEQAQWKPYGAPFVLEQTVDLAEVMADPAAHTGRTIRVRGLVADVCSKKGCWMVLADGESRVRVTMKDYGFFVDRGGAGATAELEGMLLEKPSDPELEAHYAEESRNPEQAPTGTGGRAYELVATAVRLHR